MRPSEFAQWDADDRHKVVMHQMYEAARCPSCGAHPDEAGHLVARLVTCRGCETKAAGEKELEDKRKTGSFVIPPGTRVVLGPPLPTTEQQEVSGG